LNRVDFDNMQVLDQIEHINNKIAEGNTITKICEAIGIGRTTIRDRFIKENYIFDKIKNAYNKSDDKSMIKVINEKVPHKSNTIVTIKDNKDLQSMDDFNNIKTDLLELIQNKDDLMKMLKDYKNHTNVIDVPQMDINTLPGEMQKDIMTKSLKVYEPIYKLFDDLCSQYNSVKKQDLVSLALYEFYNKYKK
jgi:uncharacterized protein YerC